jgi:hypothetical protein
MHIDGPCSSGTKRQEASGPTIEGVANELKATIKK